MGLGVQESQQTGSWNSCLRLTKWFKICQVFLFVSIPFDFKWDGRKILAVRSNLFYFLLFLKVYPYLQTPHPDERVNAPFLVSSRRRMEVLLSEMTISEKDLQIQVTKKNLFI